MCENDAKSVDAEAGEAVSRSDSDECKVPCSQQKSDDVELEPVQDTETEAPADEPTQEEEQVPSQETSLAGICENLTELQTLFEAKIARDENQTAMFDALYREMKDYKENFLLEAAHKPVIKDMLMLYDNFVELESQIDELVRANEQMNTDGITRFRTNLENTRYQLLEALYRMDATPYEEQLERLDRKLHRTIKRIPTDNPDQDGEIAQVHKIGFYWRDKVFRPEEVTVFRYVPPDPTEDKDTQPPDKAEVHQPDELKN